MRNITCCLFNYRHLIPLAVLICSTASYADMGRVYHPYVEEHEREFEYNLISRDIDNTTINLQSFGFGYAWTDKFFTEIYVLTESLTHDGEQIKSYEAELKWQLTEQGEYASDWGALVELSTAEDINAQEVAAAILWEKELTSRWVLAANVFLGYEFGDDIQSEIENALRGQLRYRKNAAFEPALELYLDDKDWAAGPTLVGAHKLSAGKQLRWELGFLCGLDNDTPTNNLRLNLEFEF